MGRLITLVTGQWADLPLKVLAPKARALGFGGLELAAWGDHFEVSQALADPGYCERKRALLAESGLEVFAVSAHLVGQAVLDTIDARHRAILPPHVWGDGDPAGVNRRAAEEMKNTAEFIRAFPDRIFHVHMKDALIRRNGRNGILGSHLPFGDPRRGWDFCSLGRGSVDFEQIIRALNDIGYTGPLSVEWEDSGMDREHGAKEACAFVRKLDFPTAGRAFDSAFER